MSHIITVTSWNISGGVFNITDSRNELLSDNISRMSKANGDLADVLRAISADFVCLQEVHGQNGVYSQTEEIAYLAGFQYFREAMFDDSHHFRNSELQIGVSVLSNYRIKHSRTHVLTNPDLVVRQSNGELWRTHTKGLIAVNSHIPGLGSITIISIHLIPFYRFSLNDNDHRVLSFWKEVDKELCVYGDTLAIIGGDFNSNDVCSRLTNLFYHHSFQDMEFHKPTHRDSYFDHIVLSKKFKILGIEVLDNYKHSDHHPCCVKAIL